MVDMQNNIISNLIFEASVKALRKARIEMDSLVKSTGESASFVKKAFNDSLKQTNLNSKIAASDALMGQLKLSAAELAMGMKRAGFAFDSAGRTVNAFGKQVTLTAKDMEAIKKGSKRFRMELLSIMFAAMALNRVLTRMWRGMITTYQKANEDVQGLGKSTWHLQAAWEFLKYSILDALTQSPLFKMIVEFLVQMIKKFNELTPFEESMIGIGLAVGTITTAIIGLLAQIGLAKTGLEALGLGGLLKDFTSAEGKLLSLKNIAKAGMGLFFVWQGIQGIMTGSLEGDLWKEFVGLLGTTLGGALIGSMFGPVGAGVGAILGLTLGIIIDVVWSGKKQKVANDINDNLKEMGLLVEKQPTWGTKIGIDMVSANLPTADLEEMRNTLQGIKDINWNTTLTEYADSGNKTSIAIDGLNIGAKKYVDLSPEFIGAGDNTAASMWGLSNAVSAVNQGNSPTGLIHIIDSEGKIIALEPTFNSSISSMKSMMDTLSVSVSDQTSKFTKLIAEIDRYIKKMEEAARAESKSRSGGITGIIKSVIGSRATGGPINKTGPYLLHDGEYVINRQDMNTMGGGETTVNNNISLTVNTQATDANEVSRIIMEELNNTYSRSNDSTL